MGMPNRSSTQPIAQGTPLSAQTSIPPQSSFSVGRTDSAPPMSAASEYSAFHTSSPQQSTYSSGPPQLGYPNTSTSHFPGSGPAAGASLYGGPANGSPAGQKRPQQQSGVTYSGNHDNIPSNPVFGISLEDLFQRDQTPVPMVVYQCIQAVDLFGLEVEGIYRINGTAAHIQQLKQLFDHGKLDNCPSIHKYSRIL
jgi:Rho GTPase-activating protein RGD1